MADNKNEGKKSGGQQNSSPVGAGKDKDPHNFANDREKAREAGRKGGKASH
jgi:general stress protein YciG